MILIMEYCELGSLYDIIPNLILAPGKFKYTPSQVCLPKMSDLEINLVVFLHRLKEVMYYLKSTSAPLHTRLLTEWRFWLETRY